MPEEGDWLMGNFGDDVVSVVIAVGAGKDEYPEFHVSRVSVSRFSNADFWII